MKRAALPRKYTSPVRTEQALQTRQRIIDAATSLFLERGYSATTVAAVASAAEVSAETVYAVFDGKRGLLQGVIDRNIMGAGDPVPLEEQAHWNAIAALPTASKRLRAYVATCCNILARTSPIHDVIRRAADSEPFAVALSARLLDERLAFNVRQLRAWVGSDLREGVSLRRAAERFCALTSPEMHHLLTARLGWSARAHEAWIASVAEQELLGS